MVWPCTENCVPKCLSAYEPRPSFERLEIWLGDCKSGLSLFQGPGMGPEGDSEPLAARCAHPPSFCACWRWKAAHCALTRQRTFVAFLQRLTNLDRTLCFFFPPTLPPEAGVEGSSAVHKYPKSTCHIHGAKMSINLATNVPQNLFSFALPLPRPLILMNASWMLPWARIETCSVHYANVRKVIVSSLFWLEISLGKEHLTSKKVDCRAMGRH